MLCTARNPTVGPKQYTVNNRSHKKPTSSNLCVPCAGACRSPSSHMYNRALNSTYSPLLHQGKANVHKQSAPNIRHTSYKTATQRMKLETWQHLLCNPLLVQRDMRLSWMVRRTSSQPPSSSTLSEPPSPRNKRRVIRKLKERINRSPPCTYHCMRPGWWLHPIP
jgi:hypothetical protein